MLSLALSLPSPFSCPFLSPHNGTTRWECCVCLQDWKGARTRNRPPGTLIQTLIWVFQPPELWKNQFLLSPLLTALWYANLSKLREVLRAAGIPREVMGQAGVIQPATCSCTACGLRKVFTLLNGGEKNQKKNNILWYVKMISNSNFNVHK